jgi:flagellar hook-associated protein 1 FlgK
MSGLFGIAASALRANQQGLSTVSQNIANVNTEGYARQQLELRTAVGGAGVDVAQVRRNFDAWSEGALGEAQSQFGAASAKSEVLGRLESSFSVDQSSLSAAFGRLQDAFAAVASAPTVRGVRTTVLEEARTVTARFQSLDRQLASLDSQLAKEIGATAERINTLTTQLAGLNQSLRSSGESSSLLDQQNQVISDLSLEVSIRLNRQDDGTVDVLLPSGQALVRGTEAAKLEAPVGPAGPYTPQLTLEGSPRDPSSALTGGRLQGLIEARAETLAPLRRDLDRLAVGFAQSLNQAQEAGFTAAGQAGRALFSGTDGVAPGLAAPGNAGTATLSVTPEASAALQGSAYELTFDGTDATLTRLSDGVEVYAGAPGDLNTDLIDGLRFSVDDPALLSDGDRFRFEPLAGAAGRIAVALSDPEGLAFNRAALSATSSSTNLSVSLPSPQTLAAPLPRTGTNDPELQVVDDGSGTLLLEDDDGTQYAFTLGEPVTLEPYGLELTVSGTPAAGDRITLSLASAGPADGGQAQLLAGDLALFSDGATAVDEYASLLGTAAGAANRASLAQEAGELVLADAQLRREAKSGVNLDEEAADLLRYQQAYQAAARVVSVADTIFQSVLSVVR